MSQDASVSVNARTGNNIYLFIFMFPLFCLFTPYYQNVSCAPIEYWRVLG